MDYDLLRENLERVSAEGSEARFLYCAADGSGEPSLRVGVPRVKAVHELLLLKNAQDKELLTGPVAFEDGVFVFRPLKVHDAFAGHLQDEFSMFVQELEEARVEAPAAPMADAEPAEPIEAFDFRADASSPAAAAAPPPAAPGSAPRAPAAAPAPAVPRPAPVAPASTSPTDPVEAGLALIPEAAALLDRQAAAGERERQSAAAVYASPAGAALREVARSLAASPRPDSLATLGTAAAAAAAAPECERWRKVAAKLLKLRLDARRLLDQQARAGSELGRAWLERRDSPPASVGRALRPSEELGSELASGPVPTEDLRAAYLRHGADLPLLDKLQEQAQHGVRRQAKALSRLDPKDPAAPRTRAALRDQIDAYVALRGLPPIDWN